MSLKRATKEDFDHWLKCDLWTLGEAVQLARGFVPDGKYYGWPSDETAPKEWAADLEIVVRGVQAKTLEHVARTHHLGSDHVVPGVFLLWWSKKEFPMPLEFLGYLQSISPPSESAPTLEISPSQQESKTRLKPLRSEQVARVRARLLAEQQWQTNPNLTTTALVESDVFKNDEFVKNYLPETRADWIRDLNPKPPEERRGRPPNQ